MKAFSAMAIILLSSLLSSMASAAPVNDFYCKRIANSDKSSLVSADPVYFQRAVKGCGNDKVEMEGVCSQQVECAYVSASLKQQISQKYDQGEHVPSFDNLPATVKNRELEVAAVEFHPSMVTCKALKAKLNGNDPICPSPNACKGDLNFNPQVAISDPAGLVNDLNKALGGGSETYLHETEGAGAAK